MKLEWTVIILYKARIDELSVDELCWGYCYSIKNELRKLHRRTTKHPQFGVDTIACVRIGPYIHNMSVRGSSAGRLHNINDFERDLQWTSVKDREKARLERLKK